MANKMICPKCESSDVSNNFSVRSVSIGSFQNEHKCNSCGYEGVFPEVQVKKSKRVLV